MPYKLASSEDMIYHNGTIVSLKDVMTERRSTVPNAKAPCCDRCECGFCGVSYVVLHTQLLSLKLLRQICYHTILETPADKPGEFKLELSTSLLVASLKMLLCANAPTMLATSFANRTPPVLAGCFRMV